MSCGNDEEGLGVYGCARCKEKKKWGAERFWGEERG